MERERADVVVVGASPAGLVAARVAAAGGADVLLCDARAQVGIPPSPAGVAFDLLMPPGEVVPRDVVARTFEGARLVSPCGATIPIPAPARLLDRTRFDRGLARAAEEAGARVRAGVRFHAASPGRLEGDAVVAEAPLLVFADGPASLAGQLLSPMADPARLMEGLAFRVRAPGLGAGAWIDVAVGSHAPWGRSQLTPREGDEASLWLFRPCGGGGAGDLAVACRAHEAALGIPRGALAPEQVGRGLDPILTIPRQIAAPGILVAGGAAGQAGIELGLVAGRMAGEVAAEAVRARTFSRGFLARYERAWMRRHQAGLLAHRRGMERLRRLGDESLHRIMVAWEGRALSPGLLLDLAHPSPWRRARALARGAVACPRVALQVAGAVLG